MCEKLHIALGMRHHRLQPAVYFGYTAYIQSDSDICFIYQMLEFLAAAFTFPFLGERFAA